MRKEQAATEVIPYQLGHKVISTDTGYKTSLSTWVQVIAKLIDAPESVIEAFDYGLIGEDSEIFNHHAELGNRINTFTLQYADGSTQCYQNCPYFDLDYHSSIVSFPLFFSMELNNELTKEEAEVEIYKLLQGVKLDGISLLVPCYKIGLDYELFNIEILELIFEMDAEAQC